MLRLRFLPAVSPSAAVEDCSWPSVRFFVALWAPFLLACANHNDKVLLSRYLKQKTIGSIVILSSLLSGGAVPTVLFYQPDVNVTLVQGSALVAKSPAV